MPSIPYSYWDEEEERRAREAAASQQQSAPQPQEQETSIREAVEGVERQEGEEGLISRLGEYIKDNFDPLNIVDNKLEQNAELTENIPVIGNVNRAVADFVPNRQAV